MCKAVAYIQGVSVAASVYSLVAVSLDRYAFTCTLNFSKNDFIDICRQSPGNRFRTRSYYKSRFSGPDVTNFNVIHLFHSNTKSLKSEAS